LRSKLVGRWKTLESQRALIRTASGVEGHAVMVEDRVKGMEILGSPQAQLVRFLSSPDPHQFRPAL